MRADDDVVETDDRSQRADRENEGKRGKPGRDKGETDDVGLARAPVAIEKGGGPLPVDIARPMHTRRFDKRFSHEWCEWSNRRIETRGKLFLARPGPMTTA